MLTNAELIKAFEAVYPGCVTRSDALGLARPSLVVFTTAGDLGTELVGMHHPDLDNLLAQLDPLPGTVSVGLRAQRRAPKLNIGFVGGEAFFGNFNKPTPAARDITASHMKFLIAGLTTLEYTVDPITVVPYRPVKTEFAKLDALLGVFGLNRAGEPFAIDGVRQNTGVPSAQASLEHLGAPQYGSLLNVLVPGVSYIIIQRMASGSLAKHTFSPTSAAIDLYPAIEALPFNQTLFIPIADNGVNRSWYCYYGTERVNNTNTYIMEVLQVPEARFGNPATGGLGLIVPGSKAALSLVVPASRGNVLPALPPSLDPSSGAVQSFAPIIAPASGVSIGYVVAEQFTETVTVPYLNGHLAIHRVTMTPDRSFVSMAIDWYREYRATGFGVMTPDPKATVDLAKWDATNVGALTATLYATPQAVPCILYQSTPAITYISGRTKACKSNDLPSKPYSKRRTWGDLDKQMRDGGPRAVFYGFTPITHENPVRFSEVGGKSASTLRFATGSVSDARLVHGLPLATGQTYAAAYIDSVLVAIVAPRPDGVMAWHYYTSGTASALDSLERVIGSMGRITCDTVYTSAAEAVPTHFNMDETGVLHPIDLGDREAEIVTGYSTYAHDQRILDALVDRSELRAILLKDTTALITGSALRPRLPELSFNGFIQYHKLPKMAQMEVAAACYDQLDQVGAQMIRVIKQMYGENSYMRKIVLD